MSDAKQASEFVRARGGERAPQQPALWFVFAGHQVLLRKQPGYDGDYALLLATADDLGLHAEQPLYVGTLDGVPCLAARLPGEDVPPGFEGFDLRRLYGIVPDAAWQVAGLAAQLLHWAETARYCPRCGTPTQQKGGEWAMECPSCGLLQYPRVHPCVIVLIYDGDGERVLLTRQPGWPAGRYGLVAGFVEPGETLEACLAREVREETGVAVTDIRYFDSQPWPFPHQLMVGFTARYAGGEIVVDKTELDDARWFSVDALPTLPPPMSIARRIIDAHVRRVMEARG